MTPQSDELDRLIDALNAGDTPTVDALADRELAGLLDAVTRVRRLRESSGPEVDLPDEGWPELVIRDLAHELKRPGVPDVDRESIQAVGEGRAPELETSGLTPLSTDRERYQSTGRRHLPRELAQMAAAILVLVAVAGVLAVLFRGQGGSDQGGIGGSATQTGATSAQLPMSITASGITVTLQMVDSTRSATRFYVDITLPPDSAPFDESAILGPSSADNTQIDGLSAQANDLRMSQNIYDATPSMAALWLDYPSPFPTNRTVTLTIKQLWLPSKLASPNSTPIDYDNYTPVPVTMHAVTGPWTFHIAPSMLASQPLPRPMSGEDCLGIATSSPPNLDCYYGISQTLAQKLVDFPVIEPTPLSALLTQDDFGVSVLRVGTTDANRPNYVKLYYPLKSGQQGVLVVETTYPVAVPTVNDGTPSPGTPVSPWGFASTPLTIRPGTLTTMTIDGVTVTRFETADTSPREIQFVWTQEGVGYNLSAPYSDDSAPLVSESDLQQMVTSIIQQSGGR